MTPLVALAIWWLAAQNLAPLARLARDVRSRDARSLAPLPTRGLPDEVAPLASALNALLERLRSSLDSQRAFVADAAHELRSPLTALKLQLQPAAPAPATTRRARRRSTRVAAGIDRAARLVEQLLTLARSEPGAAPAPPEPVDLGELAREALAAMHAVRARRAAASSSSTPSGRSSSRGERSALAALRCATWSTTRSAIRRRARASSVARRRRGRRGVAARRRRRARHPAGRARARLRPLLPPRRRAARRAAASAWRSCAASPSGTARRWRSTTRRSAACARRCASRRRRRRRLNPRFTERSSRPNRAVPIFRRTRGGSASARRKTQP